MYNAHELDVSPWINRGGPNTLAVKVTPERSLQDINGVELADSWYDWINWNHLGYQGPEQTPDRGNPSPGSGNSFVPDRNAGIWKPVYLRVSGAVEIGPTAVNSELPLPRTDSAELTIFSSLRNTSAQQVRGVLRATISRPGKPDIQVEQPVTLAAGENREITFDPARFGALAVADPDLWWPYTLGEPNLYDLQLEFRQFDRPTDAHHQRFGIRTVTEHRDQDDRFPELGTGGSFYLKVNGRDFLGSRCGLHTRPVVRRRSCTRCRHAELRQGSRPEHAATGGQVPRRTHRRDGRRDGHTADVRLDVLQPVGEVAAVGRRGQPGRAGQPALADPDAAPARVCLPVGQRK